MLKKIICLSKDEKGQSIVEFALTLPVLIMVICAIIDFGWIFTNQLVISNCSREGARYGIVYATASNAADSIKNRAFAVAPSFIKSSMTVSVSFSNTWNPRAGDVKVTTSSTVTALTPLGGIWIQGQGISLKSDCVMKVE